MKSDDGIVPETGKVPVRRPAILVPSEGRVLASPFHFLLIDKQPTLVVSDGSLHRVRQTLATAIGRCTGTRVWHVNYSANCRLCWTCT